MIEDQPQYDVNTVTVDEFFKDGYTFGKLVSDFCFHNPKDHLRFGQYIMNKRVNPTKSCVEIYYETDDLTAFEKLKKIFERDL